MAFSVPRAGACGSRSAQAARGCAAARAARLVVVVHRPMRRPARGDRLAAAQARDQLVRGVGADLLVQGREIEEAVDQLADRRIDEHQHALQRDRGHRQRLGGDQQRLTGFIADDPLRLLARQAERAFEQPGEAARSRPSAATSSARMVSTGCTLCGVSASTLPRLASSMRRARGIRREEQLGESELGILRHDRPARGRARLRRLRRGRRGHRAGRPRYPRAWSR